MFTPFFKNISIDCEELKVYMLKGEFYDIWIISYFKMFDMKKEKEKKADILALSLKLKFPPF